MSEPNSPIPTSTLEYHHELPAPEGPRPKPRYWLHVLLLLATCFTTLVTGARMQYNFAHNLPALSLSDDSAPLFPAGWIIGHPRWILAGLPFSAAVMLFFLAHEMGHYLYCRRYGVYATLPFFIPMPTLIGTMGAVIVIRSPIRSRKALFDIGIAGPIAGFVVAVALLAISLGWSKPMLPSFHPGAVDLEMGYPLIFRWMHSALAMLYPGSAIAHMPLSRLLLHPVAIAAWMGMFATALNLLPGGQLDGGHILYSIAPRVHWFVSRLAIVILLPMAYYLWTGMGSVGDSAAVEQSAASAGRRVSESVGRAAMAGAICPVYACVHAQPHSDGASSPARNGARSLGLAPRTREFPACVDGALEASVIILLASLRDALAVRYCADERNPSRAS